MSCEQNGSVVASQPARAMRGSVTAQGLRGSSRATPIVVPLDVEHLPPLPL